MKLYFIHYEPKNIQYHFKIRSLTQGHMTRSSHEWSHHIDGSSHRWGNHQYHGTMAKPHKKKTHKLMYLKHTVHFQVVS